MKKEKSCGTIVINNDRKVLLVKQIQGHYSFPKGHVEEDETEEETAIRETKEETNIDVVIDLSKRFMISYVTNKKVLKQVVFFLAKPLSNVLKKQEGEITDVMWASIDDVPGLLAFEDIILLWNNEILPEIRKIYE